MAWRKWLVVLVAAGFSACGVPEQKYKAAAAEAHAAMRDASEQRARAATAFKEIGELSAREASADAAKQRELAAELAKAYRQDRGVDPDLLGAAGYSEYQPITPNDKPEGRAQNRRIEISLATPPSELPALGTMAR